MSTTTRSGGFTGSAISPAPEGVPGGTGELPWAARPAACRWGKSLWGAAILALASPLPSAQVRLAEVMPRDEVYLADEDGDFSGWIELHNAGSSAVNLEGWSLLLGPGDPETWQLPERWLAPEERLLIFASGKDRQPPSDRSEWEPIPPPVTEGLVLWLDAAEPDTFELDAQGRVVRWEDRSGQRVGSPPEPIPPDQAEGLVLWLDAAEPTGFDVQEGPVSRWRDRSGQGHDARALSGSPRRVEPDGEGRASVRFDGVEDALELVGAPEVRTIIQVVAEDPAASLRRRTLLGSPEERPLLRGAEGRLYSDEAGAWGGQIRVWLDGERVDPRRTLLPRRWCLVTVESSTPIRIDQLGAEDLQPGTFWQGAVGELVMFETPPSSAVRRGIEAFLQRKWGLPSSAGARRNAVQTAPDARPKLAWSPWLSQPVPRFDGEEDCLVFPRLEEVRTVFWVARQDPVPGGDDGPVLGDTTYGDFSRGDEGELLSFRNASGYLRAGLARINGQQVDPVAARLPESWAVVELQASGPVRANALAISWLTPSHAFAGEVAELLVYNRALPQAQMESVREYLSAKWGLPPRAAHASFRLPETGGRLILADASGQLVDLLEWPALPPGISWGQPEPPGMAAAQGAFDEPTPGRPNGSVAAGVGPPVQMLPGEVHGEAPIRVTLSAWDPDVTIYYSLDGSTPAPPLEEPREVVWADDRIPEGARTATDTGEGWQWVVADWDGGRLAHRSPADSGLRYHFFYGAAYPLRIQTNDLLTTWVWLSPEAPPREIMLQWNDGSPEHRAYWGEDLIPHGTPGTPGRRFMGPLPPAGVWTRLEVPASAVELRPERPVTGLTFMAYGGEVWWDRSGKLTRNPHEAQRYEGPFELHQPTLVQAVAVRPGSLPGPVSARFYLPGFDTRLPVVSLGLPPEWLFDATRGMYVMRTNASLTPPYYGANFWRDWERPARFHLIEPDGRTLDHGLVGLKIQGAWSRTAVQKSFSLRARRRYGEPWIRWRVFPELPLDAYDSINLRNAGNDRFFARMRDGLLQSLMAGSAVPVQAFRPAHVFLNSQYWGILNLRERIDDEYLAAHYPGEATDGGVDLIENDLFVLEGDYLAFQELADFLDHTSLTTPEAYAALLQRVDLDNYLDWIGTESSWATSTGPITTCAAGGPVGPRDAGDGFSTTWTVRSSLRVAAAWRTTRWPRR